jgi:hypothetical protein
MQLITNVYCLRNVPLKPTCCWWADTGKYWTEELTKSKLENQASRYEDICGSEGIVPPFLTSELDECEWSASSPGQQLDRRLNGPQSRSIHCEYKNLSPLPRTEPRSSSPD